MTWLPPAMRMMLLSLLFCALAHAQTVKILPQTTGSFSQAMSTSFQVAPWTRNTFTQHPELRSLLDRLNPHHINVQVINKAVPETAPGVWDFSELDRQLQPILAAADHSPEVQLAEAPHYLYRTKTRFVTRDFVKGYADYAAAMVAHYPQVRFWGILNEPNYFHISPAEYVRLYNAAARKMKAVDPLIRLVALEIGGNDADLRRYMPVFVAGVHESVDLVGVHFYSTCKQADSDQELFDTIPRHAEQIQYLHHELEARADLAKTPVWVLENNVNADFSGGDGESMCNPSQAFVPDERGSSAFFAAWRTYAFAQFGKAGAGALYHWVFAQDAQYGEVKLERDATTQLSFWTDLWLGRYFPAEAPTRSLAVVNTHPGQLEVFAVEETSGAVAILISNHSSSAVTDNNGAGNQLRLTLDLNALPAFTKAEEIVLDAQTPLLNGPAEKQLVAKSGMQLELNGYGCLLLRLR